MEENHELVLFHSFIEETKANLEQIEQGVLCLESDPGKAGCINNLFAQFHNVKGGAKLLDIKEINDLCHAAETVLEDIKSQKTPYDHTRIEILLEAKDTLKKLVEILEEKISTKKEGEPVNLDSDAVIIPVLKKMETKQDAADSNIKPEEGAPNKMGNSDEQKNGPASVPEQEQGGETLDEVPAEETPPSITGKFLTFKLDKEDYALGISYVQDIISMIDITPVPQTSDFVKGVINLRGKVIPVIDLRLMFGMKQAEYHKETCIIIVSGRKGLIGIIVDVVSDVIDVEDTEVEDAPDFGVSMDTDFILGMSKIKKEVKILIDTEKVLGSGEMVVVD